MLLCSQPCGIRASFGGYGLVANVGPLLPSTLADRLSQGELVTVDLTRELPLWPSQCERLADALVAVALAIVGWQKCQ